MTPPRSCTQIDSGEYDLESTGAQIDEDRDAKSHENEMRAS